MITASIIADATVIGVLMVASRLPDTYNASDVHTAQMLADAVAGSFANLRLHKRLRRELIERETVSALAKTISSSLDVQSSMPDFAHDLWEIVPAHGVSISLATGLNDDTEDRWSFGVTPVAGASPNQRRLQSEMKVGGATVRNPGRCRSTETALHTTSSFTPKHGRIQHCRCGSCCRNACSINGTR